MIQRNLLGIWIVNTVASVSSFYIICEHDPMRNFIVWFFFCYSMVIMLFLFILKNVKQNEKLHYIAIWMASMCMVSIYKCQNIEYKIRSIFHLLCFFLAFLCYRYNLPESKWPRKFDFFGHIKRVCPD